ncbi:MAG: heavy-metal-associated domain-containing protein [Pseudomonadota bacterium]|nr:heavy-metal-associated domain-containing protein [Pseudomonadota bacterium]
MRLLAVLVLSLAASGAAFACPGEHAAAGAGAETKGHCDMPTSTAAAAPLPAEGKHVKLTVAGMHCGACAEKVKTALIGVEGVKGATVDATTGVAEVAFDEKKANTDKLIAAVAATKQFTATIATN